MRLNFTRKYPDYLELLGNGGVFLRLGPMSLTIIAEENGHPLFNEVKRGAKLAIRLLETVARHKGILKKSGDELVSEHHYPSIITESIEVCHRIPDEPLTPTAAIAGVIADVIADAIQKRGATKVIVDNGGDIAIRLQDEESVKVGIAPMSNLFTHVIEVSAGSGIGGIATSGLGGVGLTKGVALAATTIAERASLADVSSTVVGNSTICEGIDVIQCPANTLDPDSDMGIQSVTLQLGEISKSSALRAIKNGLQVAERLTQTRVIKGAIIFVGDEVGMVPPRVARASSKHS